MKRTGLTQKDAARRIQKYGFNEIKEVAHVSLFSILLRQIRKNFIIYLLVAASLISFFVGKDITGYTILVIVLIIIAVGFVQEYKAEWAIKALKNMMVPFSLVIRDGKEREIFSRDMVPDDIVILKTGERVPADCVILEGKEIRVDESILTGESKEIRKYITKSEKKYQKENMLFMGTFLVNGRCVARVVHTGMNTEFGKITGMISTVEKELPLQKKVNRLIKYMTVTGLFFSILTGLIIIARAPIVTNDVIVSALIIILAVAVASFPEGFPVVLITALASGSYRMARKNAIINRMSIIETLGETTVICSDKTGTITKGEMTVKKIFAGEKIYDVTGAGHESEGIFLCKEQKIVPEKEKILSLLLKAATLCNDSVLEMKEGGKEYKVIGTPTEAALAIMSAKAGISRDSINAVRKDEIPFSSERKIMSVICKETTGSYVYSKGATEIILKKCRFMQDSGRIVRMSSSARKKILSANHKLASAAFRTLALAYKKADSSGKLDIEEHLVFLGIVGMEDPPRDDIEKSIKLCKTAGIKVKMITGDDKKTAVAIAKQIGLRGNVIDGNELDDLTDDELSKIVGNTAIFARVMPEHKLRIVRALKQNREIVAMTGDGVNDAPAMKEAHIGIAMGKKGTDVSRSVSDLTLRDDNFSTIVDAIKEGRTIFTNIQKFSTYQISINFAQLGLIFLAILLGFPLPLIAMQILFMNLFSDEITAITLAFNPYSRDVMTVKPRKKNDIINKRLLAMIITSGMIVVVSSLLVFYYVGVVMQEPENVARTVVFITMVLFGLTNAFNFRSFRYPVYKLPFLANKYLVIAAAISVLLTLLIIYTPLSMIFEIVPIKLNYWVLAFAASLSVIFIFDIIKSIENRKFPKKISRKKPKKSK